jgi:hypothetical protein
MRPYRVYNQYITDAVLGRVQRTGVHRQMVVCLLANAMESCYIIVSPC